MISSMRQVFYIVFNHFAYSLFLFTQKKYIVYLYTFMLCGKELTEVRIFIFFILSLTSEYWSEEFEH